MSSTALLRTAEFADALLEAVAAPLPPAVTIAAKRSMFNVLGTTVGAAWSPAADAIVAAAHELSAPGRVQVLGRPDVLDEHWAALLSGTAGHYDDFDDTHLATVIHPGASTLAVLVALHESTGASGDECLRAFAFGCEVQLRIGKAISPNHYDRGWHITGTCGVFGATVSAAVLMGLDRNELQAALAAASTMTLGQREAFGSMTKPYHAGKAAANGILAARLGTRGYAGDTDPLGDAGVLTIFADSVDEAELLRPWSDDWELERNAFKPYPCGIVAHPAIDAAIDASARLSDSSAIESVEVSCHPLVPELMGIVQPTDGLQARFSARHGVAVGLLDGQAGLREFSNARATAPDVIRLRGLTALTPSSEIARDEVRITVMLADSQSIVAHVPHARGSLARPLTDGELLAKVDALMAPVIGAGSAARISQLVETIDVSTNFTDIVAAARPLQNGTPQ
jgi:2-methylcitrate dehydratase PrpD